MSNEIGPVFSPGPLNQSIKEEIRKRREDLKRIWDDMQVGSVVVNGPPTTATEIKIKAEEAASKAFKLRRDPMTNKPVAEDMIHMRLRFDGLSKDSFIVKLPWRHMSAFYDDTTAAVMVVTNAGQSVLIEDDPNLFPSDTLIGKLKILIETGDVK